MMPFCFHPNLLYSTENFKTGKERVTLFSFKDSKKSSGIALLFFRRLDSQTKKKQKLNTEREIPDKNMRNRKKGFSLFISRSKKIKEVDLQDRFLAV